MTPQARKDDGRVLKELEQVRVRPRIFMGEEMYQVAFREPVDNALDELRRGHGKHITITLREDKSIEISDEGRGLPVSFDHELDKNGIVKYLGSTFAGSNYDNATSDLSGTNGVGASGSNALSQRFDVIVVTGGKKYQQSFKQGVPGHFDDTSFDAQAPFTKGLGEELLGFPTQEHSGTTLRFVLDRSVDTESYDAMDINRGLFEAISSTIMAKGAELDVINEGYPDKVRDTLVGTFHGTGSITDLHKFVDVYNETLEVENPEFITVSGESSYGAKNMPFTYSASFVPVDENSQPGAYGFAKNVYNIGTHIAGMQKAIANVLPQFVKSKRDFKPVSEKNYPLGEDYVDSMSGLIYVNAESIEFNGQDKQRVTSMKLGNALQKDIETKLSLLLQQQPELARIWFTQAQIAMEDRQGVEITEALLKDDKKTQGLSDSMRMPDKYLGCRNTGYGSNSEFILVEGDSAMNPVLSTRDPDYQAVFPMRGKGLNAYGKMLSEALEDDQFKAIYTILGAGAGKSFDKEKLRHDRVIILADADPDGFHISGLLLASMFKFYPQLIEDGHVFLGKPPLFKDSNDKKTIYTYNDEDHWKAVEELKQLSTKKIETHRFKGLGSMDKDDFKTVLDFDKRQLIQINLSDDIREDREMMDILFGEKMSEERRDFLADWEPLESTTAKENA